MTVNYRLRAVLLLIVVLCTEHLDAFLFSNDDCAVSKWGSWTSGLGVCEEGYLVRQRSIISYPSYVGIECPFLVEFSSCMETECPIDCQWGEWTNCSPFRTKSRFRNITTPSMFGGFTCTGTNIEVTSGCSPPAVKTMECKTDQRLCQDEITCVRDTLACNGDDDCTDYSDELHCDEINSPCDSQKDRIPNIDVVGSGFHIVRNKESGTILDNWRFNGRCSIVTSGDHNGHQFRLPANILSYHSQAVVSTPFSTKSYECARSFFREEREERKTQLEAGFSVFGISVKAAYSSDQKRKSIVENGSKTKSKYFKLLSRIKVAHFRTLRRNLILVHSFRQRELVLPEYFDYAEYSNIITDFGTHYYSSGVMGGEFELILRYDRAELEESGLTEEEQRNCITGEVSYMTMSGEVDRCSANSLSQRHGGSFYQAAEEIIATVKGGSSDTAASLSFNQHATPSKEDFDAWAKTVKDNSAVIDFKLAPISAVFKSKTKQAHMDRALHLYLRRFDPAVCPQECLNGGSSIVTDEGKACQCLCAPNYFGPSCRDM